MPSCPACADLSTGSCSTSARPWSTRRPTGADGQTTSVGDRVDNDVVPAAAAGMVAVHLRRGPWGFLQSAWPGVHEAALQIDDLGALSDALASLGNGSD